MLKKAVIDEIHQVMLDFPSPEQLAREIIRLRKNQMPEEVPEIQKIYAVKQAMHDSLYYLSTTPPRTPGPYRILYRPVDDED